MKRTQFLVQNLAVIATLLLSSASLIPMAQAEPIVKPMVIITQATDRESSLSSYAISALTSDGGWVNITFVWQIGTAWRWPWTGREMGLVFDTPLTLQMSKFFQNGSLDFAVTYSPLYLIQYNDTNENGLLDLRATRTSREEIPSGDIDWARAEKPLRTYPLTPVFNFIDFERGAEPHAWRWVVSPLQNQTIILNNINTYEFSWNASATVPTYTWSFEEGYPQIIKTTANAAFGFHLILDPEKPQIKYDFNFSGVSWPEGKNVKLALLSAVQYHSKESAVVGTDGERYGFDKTWAFKSQRATISESTTATMKAFITYRSDAVVDGYLQPDAVKTSFQPLFLIPTYSPVPPGVYIQGMRPDLTTHAAQWKSYVAFSHQLGLPRFNSSLSQDPIIGAEVLLLISGFGFLPEGLLTPQILTLTTVVVTLAFAMYWLKAKRSLKRPMTDSLARPLLCGFMGIQVFIEGGGT